MPKSKPVVPTLPTSPMNVVCPRCKAENGRNCESSSGVQLPMVHNARIKAAAKEDKRLASISEQVPLA
jgi:hypothetical protein